VWAELLATLYKKHFSITIILPATNFFCPVKVFAGKDLFGHENYFMGSSRDERLGNTAVIHGR
jgi:hypothetical protein